MALPLDHGDIEPLVWKPDGDEGAIVANITMMCGCPIEKDGTWPESNFTVIAKIDIVGTTITQTIPMPCDHTASFFKAPAKLKSFGNPPDHSTIQNSTRNAGPGQAACIPANQKSK